jgi:DNA-binding Xre family transcriptional regulator
MHFCGTKGGMKTVKSNFAVLLAERQKRDGKRTSLRSIARATGLNEYTVRGFANDTLSEYSRKSIAALCRYLDCTPGDLLVLEEVQDTDPASAA